MTTTNEPAPAGGELQKLIDELLSAVPSSIHNHAWTQDAIKALQLADAALAPPSGEGADAFRVMRSAFVTSESCGPEGDYRLVFRFRSLEALQQAHREWVTTPQSAPVDGDAVQQALLVINDAENDARHRGDYARANALVKARVTLYRASATPPPASQERGGLRWPSSLGIAAIAREIWGNPIPPEAYAFAKRLHSAASPPSSAAEASINSPEIDSKLIPDAAEQAKPDDCPFCGQPQHYTDEDCPLLSRAHTTAVAEQAQAGERLSVDEIEGYAKGLEARDMFAEAALLRRLAGGVTDEMAERAAFTWRYYTGSTENNARMRAALVAALGAK